MDESVGASMLPGWDELDERVSDSHIKLANLFGKSAPSWLPSWLESFLLRTGRYDVLLDKSKPSRAQRLAALKLDKESALLALQAARASRDGPLARRWTLKIKQIEAEICSISSANGGAKPGPNKSAIPPKVLMAARLVEIYLFVNGKEPSARNRKLAIALASLLDTLRILRKPIGNRLNGARQAFEAGLSVSRKVSSVDLRRNDAMMDEIVLARILTRRSLEQCAMRGRVPWIIPGMNGPVNAYNPKTEI